MSSEPNAAYEPHPWVELTPTQVLEKLVHEIYTPVSALGSEVDRLASGAFEDDDLLELIGQIRENVNALGRLVVSLKRYTSEREPGADIPQGDNI
jgi:signal transduction histidine kinase